ncbi:hypothetical protein [Paraglaciecola polaris]|uniref:Uncharacterized protein n=1 Tax=Paraglaciecola polaris LMG 21857 TaxID=1129793 RepID=K6ZSA9_9ALTE|nr:hypothetical protein [Paraglaciecola polaris]GAC31718.1 hypothetical protein GPLA_0802 [Paraglaciecola polaris LMG 21857]
MRTNYPPLNDLFDHAHYLTENSQLNLCQSQDLVAKIYNQKSWNRLIKSAGKTYIPRTGLLPLFSLPDADYKFMWELFDLHSQNLKLYFDTATCPPNCLLEHIINKNLKRIEDNQIRSLQENFYLENDTTEQLALIIGHVDNGAANVLHRLRMRPVNLWLESSFFQQKIYAYFTIENQNVFIKIVELYSLIYEDDDDTKSIPIEYFAEFMLLFARQISEQFKNLGYEPFFLFCSVNDCPLFDLVDNTEVNQRMKHLVLKLVDKLLEDGGKLQPPSSNNVDSGIRIQFS